MSVSVCVCVCIVLPYICFHVVGSFSCLCVCSCVCFCINNNVVVCLAVWKMNMCVCTCVCFRHFQGCDESCRPLQQNKWTEEDWGWSTPSSSFFSLFSPPSSFVPCSAHSIISHFYFISLMREDEDREWRRGEYISFITVCLYRNDCS